jgi:fermentation-respiration switch protein FrsA (DUF1100 family)
MLRWLERRMVFQPASVAKAWFPPENPLTRDVWFPTPNGRKLHGWWLPPARPDAGAILLAHGNGGNISHRSRIAAKLQSTLGTGVLLFDYPGYGRSAGKPSEAGCYAAGETAYRWLIDEAEIPAHRIVLFGESLGGGTAVELATRVEHRALVLLFTFTSLPAAAKFHFPRLPVNFLMRFKFDNLKKIPRCRRPVFIAHGTADEIVPFAHGEALFAAANEPKAFFRMDGFTHNILLDEPFYAALGQFLATHAP